jgi:hypothetical protein
MALIDWVPDFQSIDTSSKRTVCEWDAATNVVENMKTQMGTTGAAIPFPASTVDFGTGACHIDGFSWSDGDGTYTVPDINIPVGAVVICQVTDSGTGFSLQLTTREWLRQNGSIKAVYY